MSRATPGNNERVEQVENLSYPFRGVVPVASDALKL
jgi:hypothetical protein